MLLLESNILEFILSSPYLQSLLSNGPFPEEGLEIPDGNGKQDLTVSIKLDLIELLSTIRFWLVPEVSEKSSDLLKFAFSSASQTDFVEVAAEFRNHIPLVDELLQIVTSRDNKRLEIAAKYGRLCVLRYLCEEVGLKPSAQTACVAAGEGHFECLKYLHSRGAPFYINVIQAAARGGHFDCLKVIIGADNASSESYPWIEIAINEAAQHGHVACVKQMLTEWGEAYGIHALSGAAKGNHLELLRLATSVGHDNDNVERAMSVCALNGHLECLEHLHSLGYSIDVDLMRSASTAGHLNCLQFLHEHNYPGSDYVCCCTAESGRLDCLTYAHEQGMPWDESTCQNAAQGGHLACLQYAREHGCPWGNDARIAESACHAPTIDCLLYVLEHGAVLTSMCTTTAINSKSLAVMQFLHARGFTWNTSDCETAFRCESLECLRFLHEIGTPWTALCTLRAVQNQNTRHGAHENYNSLEIVEYLHTHGCPWHTDTCLAAVRYGRLECLQYAHEHGAPWTEDVCRNATTAECYEYAVAHGCPGAELNTRFFDQGKPKRSLCNVRTDA